MNNIYQISMISPSTSSFTGTSTTTTTKMCDDNNAQFNNANINEETYDYNFTQKPRLMTRRQSTVGDASNLQTQHMIRLSSSTFSTSAKPLRSLVKLLSIVVFVLFIASNTVKVDGAGELEFHTFQRLIQLPFSTQKYELNKFCDSNSPQSACELVICAREFRWRFADFENIDNEWNGDKCRFGYGAVDFTFDKTLGVGAYTAPIAAGESLLKMKFHNSWENSFAFNIRIRRKMNKKIIFLHTIHQSTFAIGDDRRQFNANFTSAEFGAIVELKMRFRSNCAKNYYGSRCEIRCETTSYNNGSHFECSSDNGSRRCQVGWYGAECNLAEKCLNANCVHGKCDPDSGMCICEEGYKGENCDQCKTYVKCQGHCLTRPYECVCPEGRGGLHCEKDITYCATHSPCQNDGVCSNHNNGSYTCRCKLGFSGRNCEHTIDSCAEFPCKNGGKCFTSSTHPQGFRCECPLGVYGRFCQSRASSCRDFPCENGATCAMKSFPLSNKLALPTSERSLAWRDAFALPSSKFVESAIPFQCFCTQGWAETLCDTPANWCTPTSCFNDGTCVESLSSAQGFICRCATGFAGPRCEWNVDDCKDNPCQNNAECVDEIDGFQCKCTIGFSGELCQYGNGTQLLERNSELNAQSPTRFIVFSLALICILLILILVVIWNLRAKFDIKNFNGFNSPAGNGRDCNTRQSRVFSTNIDPLKIRSTKTSTERRKEVASISMDEMLCSSCTSRCHLTNDRFLAVAIPPPTYSESIECNEDSNEHQPTIVERHRMGSVLQQNIVLEEQQQVDKTDIKEHNANLNLLKNVILESQRENEPTNERRSNAKNVRIFVEKNINFIV